MIQQGILIVLSGPSGTGKGTICKQLLLCNQQLQYSISVTTRESRNNEANGVNYWFTSHAEFEQMIHSNELLEWAEVYGNYYGTLRSYVCNNLDQGRDVILEIDTQGAMQVKAKFPQGVFIYIVPPSLDELANRIYKRGTDNMESISKRLSSASKELVSAMNYDYVVVNDEVDVAVKKICSIIEAEKLKVQRNIGLIEAICHKQL